MPSLQLINAVLVNAWQVPLGQRFRHVLTEHEHFSPQSMVQQLQVKGAQVRVDSSLPVCCTVNVHPSDCLLLYSGLGIS